MYELTNVKNELAKTIKGAEQKFITITPEKMALIESRMGEIDRATRSFSKRNSQIDMKLRTLTMLSVDAPYRTLRQILAQIENKRMALQQAYFDLQEKNVQMREYQGKDDELSQIKAARLQCEINSSSGSVEASLKEIGMLQTAYQEICESHNIPDEWDEEDMENDEIMFNIKSMFRNGIRDIIVSGRIGHGTQEWFEQFGINPIEAYSDVANYVENKHISHDYESMMKFLNDMYLKYKDHYLKVMKTLGIKTLIDSEWLYKKN